VGAKAFGVQTPTQGEDAVSWQTWSDGAGSVPTITGDADWGKLKLDLTGEEGRSAVIDTGSAASRTFTLTENRYGTGEESATLQLRGDTSVFLQDAETPDWENYTTAITRTWRYVQVRATTLATYYVDATGGDDEADGTTPATAWQTITKVNGATLAAGDRVLFKRGETWAGQFAPTQAGSSGAYITFGAYGSGADPIINGASVASALYINSAGYRYLRFEDIDFSGCNGSQAPGYLQNVRDLYFSGCTFRDGNTKSGMTIESTGSAITNVTFDGCTARDNDNNGFLTCSPYNQSVSYTGCTAYNNGTDVDGHHGFYIGFGATVDGCTAYDNASAGFKLNDNETAATGYVPTLKNSTAYGNRFGVVVTHHGSVVYNNLLYSNDYNLQVYGNAYGGAYKVYHNTLVNGVSTSERASIFFTTGVSANSLFKNNLFIQDAAVVTKANFHFNTGLGISNYAAMFDYNAYYYTSTNPTAANIIYSTADTGDELKQWGDWQTAGAEAHGTLLTALPGFTTRYTNLHPADGGNLEGLGVALDGYTTDKDGVTWASPPTPGCYEVVA